MPHNKLKNRKIENQIKDDLGFAELWDTIPTEVISKIMPVIALGRERQIDTETLSAQFSNGTTVTVPANEVWEIININVRFTTTATVGTRTIQITVNAVDGTEIVFQCLGDATQTASLTRNYTFSPSITTTDNQGSGLSSLVHFIKYLKPGWSFTFADRGGVDTSDSVLMYLMLRKYRTVE